MPPVTAVKSTVPYGTRQRLRRVRSDHGSEVTGPGTGTVFTAPYVRLVRGTVLSPSTIPVCMVATVTRNTGLVALLNWGGVTCNTRPVAMNNARGITLYWGPNSGPAGLQALKLLYIVSLAL